MIFRESRNMIAWGVLCAALAVAGPAGAEWNKGLEAYNSKDYGTAASEFEAVTKTNPDYAGGFYMLGLCQRMLGQISPAVANLRKAVEIDSKAASAEGKAPNASYSVGLAQALLQAKQYGDAYSVLKPMNMGSMDARYRSSYALLFAQAATKTNRPEEAIRSLNTQIRADGSNERLYQALGVAQDAAGDDGQAFNAFKRAFELSSRDLSSGRSAVYSGIAAARRSSSNSQKANYYNDAGRIAEQLVAAEASFEHKLLAGEAWLGAKQYQKAVGWFDQAKAAQPQNALVHYYRAQCNTSLGKLDTAIGDLQAALRIGASGKLRNQIYNQMGYVYDKKKDYQRAASAYGEAGNSRKVSEMQTKAEQNAQNVAAAQEQAEFRRKLQALELQITELEEIGEVDEANELRKQLEELRKHLD
jgi:tetratricopeptide (TPR) repeat protein